MIDSHSAFDQLVSNIILFYFVIFNHLYQRMNRWSFTEQKPKLEFYIENEQKTKAKKWNNRNIQSVYGVYGMRYGAVGNYLCESFTYLLLSRSENDNKFSDNMPW